MGERSLRTAVLTACAVTGTEPRDSRHTDCVFVCCRSGSEHLVDSLARPGGNSTAVTALDPRSFLDKEVDLLKELLPTARRVALVVNGRSASPRFVSAEAPHAAARRGHRRAHERHSGRTGPWRRCGKGRCEHSAGGK